MCVRQAERVGAVHTLETSAKQTEKSAQFVDSDGAGQSLAHSTQEQLLHFNLALDSAT